MKRTLSKKQKNFIAERLDIIASFEYNEEKKAKVMSKKWYIRNANHFLEEEKELFPYAICFDKDNNVIDYISREFMREILEK